MSYPTSSEIASELRGTLGLLYRRLRQTMALSDLTLSENSALSRLAAGGPMTGAELAKLERVTPQSIGAIVAALEARGMIERRQDPNDGRRRVLSLTDAGHGRVQNKRSARTQQLTAALETLTGAERAQLQAAMPLLERIADQL